MSQIKVTKVCESCGAIMYNVGPARKRCDACRYGYTYRKKPKSKGSTLRDIMREAAKEGLQYGQYCIKHGLY